MKRVAPLTLVIAVLGALLVGGAGGFFLGLVSTRAGKSFVQSLVQDEQNADVSHPTSLAREKFQLQYPANWHIKTEDYKYDPDHMFSIESPGSAFVMFVLGPGDTDPEHNLQLFIRQFEKLMGSPAIDRFETYGRLPGKGATLHGKLLGNRTTVKLFAAHENGMTILITQQSSDEDLPRVQEGMRLIETSFTLNAK